MADVVIDASALVDLLIGGPIADKVADRISGHTLHGPAHLDAESISALGRLHRAGDLAADDATRMIGHLSAAPIVRHALAELLLGAWARRNNLRLADALYVELASALDLPLISTDRRLQPIELVEVISE